MRRLDGRIQYVTINASTDNCMHPTVDIHPVINLCHAARRVMRGVRRLNRMRVLVMKTFPAVVAGSFLLTLCFCAAAQTRRAASARATAGSVCVAAVPRPNSEEISLANPAGGNRSFNFSVQIDDMPAMDVPFDAGKLVGGLSLGKNHSVKIRRDGESSQSFKFTFTKFASRDLCLWFKPLYETWQLWEAKRAGAMCRCNN